MFQKNARRFKRWLRKNAFAWRVNKNLGQPLKLSDVIKNNTQANARQNQLKKHKRAGTNLKNDAFEHDKTRNEGEILYFSCTLSTKKSQYFVSVHEKAEKFRLRYLRFNSIIKA
jgi:hypothetical protein